MPIEVVDELVEADIGLWTDLSWPEIADRWPDESQLFHQDPEEHGYLGGENLAQVRARTVPAMERLIARHSGESLLVVSHGAVNRVLLAHWMGMPLRFARKIPQDNAGINLVEFQSGHVKVRTINAASHSAWCPASAA
jgi:broad specificity phosphatase PhoE